MQISDITIFIFFFTKKKYLNLDPKDTQTQILGTLGIKTLLCREGLKVN